MILPAHGPRKGDGEAEWMRLTHAMGEGMVKTCPARERGEWLAGATPQGRVCMGPESPVFRVEDPHESWLLLHSQPHKEYVVRDSLAGRGFEAYLPEEPNRWQRRDRRPCRPFFPQYLFVRFPGPDHLEEVQWTPGLRRIVAFGSRPAVVPQALIDHIRQRLAVLSDLGGDPLTRGDRVEIVEGAFRGFDAVFDRRLTRSGRVRVLLEHASKVWVPVELDLWMVRKRSA